MKRRWPRKSKFYNGTKLTTFCLGDVLPVVMHNIGELYKERGDLVLAAWPAVVGKNLAPMTEAISFQDGVLTVNVKNSTLFSLLTTSDKPRILRSLRDKFPKTKINNVFFRMG